MHSSETKIQACCAALEKANSNLVWDILRQSQTFYQWGHYPEGDVHDQDSHSQYYYHAHDTANSKRLPEHGHFHIFIRQEGISVDIKPLTIPDTWKDPDNTDGICHLVAIAMDNRGYPLRLFTTNRWLTGETWYPAESVIKLLDAFSINHTWPSWPTNIWITEMLKLYKPQIKEILLERDSVIKALQAKHPDKNHYEDRQLEVLSSYEL